MENLKDALSLLFGEPMELSRELTAQEEREAFLYTSKINAAKAFSDKI